MSEIRKCDSCGTIFSVLEEGWGTAPVSRQLRNPVTGRMEEHTEQRDSCPNCMTKPTSEVELHMPGQPDYAKIRRLEKELLPPDNS